MQKIQSAYIHIPFCSSICSYCDFCKVFYHKKLVTDYLKSLENEILTCYRDERLSTIYIGGGTPSCLDMEDTEYLLELLSQLKKEKDYEYTIEANVDDITEEKLKLWHSYGINRLSIGIETTNEKFSSFLNRKIQKEVERNKIFLAKKYFQNISIDLMYAFPMEEQKDLENDLSFLQKINIPHVSIYSLIIEEHTKLSVLNTLPISPEKEVKMYDFIVKKLKEMGYQHYEISNFARKGYESRHNLTYWNNEEYYGFGLGASGYVNGVRYTNTKSLQYYLKGKRRMEEEEITKEVAMENEMILGLRKIEGVDQEKFFQKYSLKIEDNFDIINLIEKNLLTIKGKYLSIPEDKLYISNSILVNFIGGSKNGRER